MRCLTLWLSEDTLFNTGSEGLVELTVEHGTSSLQALVVGDNIFLDGDAAVDS